MSAWTENAFARFWNAMREIYGRRWIEEHGDAPGDLWRRSLQELSYERVAATIEDCRTRGDQHPVTLSQFMGRAQAIKLRQVYHKALPAPDKPIITHEDIAPNLERLQSTLRKRRTPYMPGESSDEYQRELQHALNRGETKEDFVMRRCKANGWRAADEIAFLKQLYDIGRADLAPSHAEVKAWRENAEREQAKAEAESAGDA